MCGAVLVNRCALDKFHHQGGQALRRGTAVEKMGYIGVIQRSARKRSTNVGKQKSADDLNCDVLVVFVVSTGGPVNDTHAANSDLIQKSVGFYPRVRPLQKSGSKKLGSRGLPGRLQTLRGTRSIFLRTTSHRDRNNARPED
jgi:hypothetical protein